MFNTSVKFEWQNIAVKENASLLCSNTLWMKKSIHRESEATFFYVRRSSVISFFHRTHQIHSEEEAACTVIFERKITMRPQSIQG